MAIYTGIPIFALVLSSNTPGSCKSTAWATILLPDLAFYAKAVLFWMRCSQSQPNQDSSYLKMQYVQYVPFTFQIQSSPSVIHVAGYAKAKSVMSNIHTMILPEKPCQTWAYCRSCAPRALPNRDRETVALQEVDTRPVLDSTKAGLLNGPQTPACGKASRLAVLGTTTSPCILQKGQARFCCALSSLIEINYKN